MERGILLFRHGETEWNAIGRLQGSDDSPLTARGLAQAARLAEWAARRGVRHVVASPLGRAQATARRIADACGATLTVRPALAEMNFGDCAGFTLAECDERFPGLLEERAKDRWAHRWPGGEGYPDLVRRLADWLAAEPGALAGEDVAVVAHQALNRALLQVLTGCPPERVLAGAQSAAQAIEVFAGGDWQVLDVAESEPAAHPHGVI